MSLLKESKKGQAQKHMPIILAVWKAKAGGSPKHLISGNPGQVFETSLTNMMKPHLYLKYKKLARCGGGCM